ncbi:MAG: triphosphoribosyl-dephospho-CoA synthase [Pirellulaceae bacterium]
MSRIFSEMSVGGLAALACQLECAAPKVGNVHRAADFEDVTLYDFLISGQIVGNAIDRLKRQPVGVTVLACVEETVRVARSNTNLGMVLLLVPLAKAIDRLEPGAELGPNAVSEVLQSLDSDDSQKIYAAIRAANPGGMNSVEHHDVRGPAPASLLTAMQDAADRDLIARQFVNQFREVFASAGRLQANQGRFGSLAVSIVVTHLELIAEHGDSLIARKCGIEISDHARVLAQRALAKGIVDGWLGMLDAVADLDFWMRSDGHRRNPGSTADIIAAALLVALFNDWISLKFALGN